MDDIQLVGSVAVSDLFSIPRLSDELQARVDAARAAKKVTDPTVKDVQTALSAVKGTSVRRKSGKRISPPIIAQILALKLSILRSHLCLHPWILRCHWTSATILVWLDNLGFMSETSQPLNVLLNSVSLVNTVPINNPEGMEVSVDANGELDGSLRTCPQGGDDFTAALSQLDWNVRRPDSFDLSSSTGTRGINFEGWGYRHCFHRG
ncbi:hypothetical protein B0H14DRAFT_3727685 [Mycena olivaceomarginata]|nr:hypothetical protein B0H14DRAFT_3727685 [Mycena olivaceomarginata]